MREFVPYSTLKRSCDCYSESMALAISGRNVLIYEREGSISLPLLHELPEGVVNNHDGIVVGELGGRLCSGFICDEYDDGIFKTVEMRSVFPQVSGGTCYAICRAKMLLEWKKRHTYCGACGTLLESSANDIAMKCPACKEAFYPQVAPAVIVAVTKEDKILLAHNYRFKERVHSLIAGFVEAGESIEQAISREIFEETGINVCDVRYVSSQSWPFPNSLMLGFTAKYASGTLEVDGTELECADWFSVDDLPQLPDKGSIARMIIDDFCSEKRFFS